MTSRSGHGALATAIVATAALLLTAAVAAPRSVASPGGRQSANAANSLPLWATPPSRTVVVPPTIDPTGTTDVSVAFASFVASVPDGSRIVLLPGATYRMERTLVLRNRNQLTLDGNGATFVATSTGDRTRSNIAVFGGSSIVVTHLKIRGANPNAGTGDAAYVPALEAQHGIEVLGVRGFAAIEVTITDTYGDFIYFDSAPGAKTVWTGPALVRGSTFARNGRQGISLIAVRDAVIEQSTFTNMRRATFDFEPMANYGDGAERVTIQDNHIDNGRLLFIAATGYGPVNDITVQRNRLDNLKLSIEMHPLDGVVRRNWRVLDNVSTLPASTPHHTTMRFYDVDGLVMHGNVQPMKPTQVMYGARVLDGQHVDISGNDFANAVAQWVAW